jgi:hypothetical protein
MAEEPKEQMISIPVKQYADYIMAMQKLIDIALVAEQNSASGDTAFKIVNSIRAMCRQSFQKDKRDGEEE